MCTSPCSQLLQRHTQGGLREVPAEVAELVSRRTLGLIELPAELEEALADALRTGGGMRLLRRQTAALTQELKARSRTESRGGVHAAAALAAPDAAPRAKRPRLQARRRAAGTAAPLPAILRCVSPACAQHPGTGSLPQQRVGCRHAAQSCGWRACPDEPA